jgi:hypothetical protein
MPLPAGIQDGGRKNRRAFWIPAIKGMTESFS